MDNVTHALAGLLVAEAALSGVFPPGSARLASFRRRAWFASALANNLPDFDFVYGNITEGRLGYLLHHRGHTHTLVIGFALGLLAYLGFAWFARRELQKPGAPALDEATVRNERRLLLGLCLAGPAIHIGMDFSNNYGVHPFWPFSNDWFYGDSIFIIEPWFLVFTVPPLFFASRALWARALFVLFLVAGVGLAWFFPLVGPGTAAVLTLGAAAWFAVTARTRPERRGVQSLGGSLLVLLTFVVAGRAARAQVLAAGAGSGVTHLDAVLTPGPSNPLCWSALTIATRGDRYELKAATLSLAPSLLPPEQCRFEPSGRSLPPSVERTARTSAPGLRWELAWHAPLAELRELARSNCAVSAFLRYSRAPYFFEQAPGTLYLGDLRYDRAPEPEFTELEVPARPTACPRFIPPWRPPRHELLAPE